VGFACLYAPMLATVSLWFRKGYGLALGIVTAGGAIGQAVVPPLFQSMILEFGWRQACAWLGLGYLAILMPVMLLMARPERREAISSVRPAGAADGWGGRPLPAMLLAGLAGLTCCALMGVPNVHLIAYADSLGI